MEGSGAVRAVGEGGRSERLWALRLGCTAPSSLGDPHIRPWPPRALLWSRPADLVTLRLRRR